MPHSGIAAPTGPALRRISTLFSSMPSAGSSMRLAIVCTSSNTTARPRWRNSFGSAAQAFITAPSGARLPFTTTSGLARLHRAVQRPDDLRINNLGGLDDFADRAPVDRPRVQVQKRFERLEQGGHATGRHEPLGQVLAGRLDIGDQRHAAGDLVEAVQGQRHAHAAGERQQVDDDVGRAAHRAQEGDGIVEGARIEDFLRARAAFGGHARRCSGPPRGRIGCGGGRSPAPGCCRAGPRPAPRRWPTSRRRYPSRRSGPRVPMTLRSKEAKSHSRSGQRATGQPGARRRWRSPTARQSPSAASPGRWPERQRGCWRWPRPSAGGLRLVAAAEQHHRIEGIAAQASPPPPSPAGCGTGTRSA